MNILQLEDTVKGMPDQNLHQEAKAPSGQVPQYLVISEIQRRTKMRKEHDAMQQQATPPTVAEQVLQQGIGAMAPQPPQGAAPQQGMPPQGMPPRQGMAQGGIVRMQNLGQVPYRGPQQRLQGFPAEHFDNPLYGMSLEDQIRYWQSMNNAPFNTGIAELDAKYQAESAPRSPTNVTDIPGSQKQAWMDDPNDPYGRAYQTLKNPPHLDPSVLDRPSVDRGVLDRPPVDSGAQVTDAMSVPQAAPAIDLGIGQLFQSSGAQVAEGQGWKDKLLDKWYRGPGSWSGNKPKMPPSAPDPYDTALDQPNPDPWMPSDLLDLIPKVRISDNRTWQDLAREGQMDQLQPVKTTSKKIDGIATQAPTKAAPPSNSASTGITTLNPTAKEQEQSALSQLMAQVGRTAETPDFSDLVEAEKQAGISNAMIQLGAGVASNRWGLSSGLSAAGNALTDSAANQRELQVAQRAAESKADSDSIQRDVYALASAAQVTQTADALEREALRQGGLNLRSAIESALRSAADQTANIFDPEEKQKKYREIFLSKARTIGAAYGLDMSKIAGLGGMSGADTPGTVRWDQL